MSMTDEELRESVTIYWTKESLHIPRAAGWYILQMQKRYRILQLDDLVDSSNSILRMFTYTWAMIRALSDIVSLDPFGEPLIDSPHPKLGELTIYTLEIDDVEWETLDREHYFLMIDTSIKRLIELWVDHPEVFWSDHHLEITRNLFEICKQYLVIHGIAESIFGE